MSLEDDIIASIAKKTDSKVRDWMLVARNSTAEGMTWFYNNRTTGQRICVTYKHNDKRIYFKPILPDAPTFKA